MRRTLRDSIVGFSLLGGILVFTFFYSWIRGVKLSSKNWHLFAEFNNASGLSKKSPVTYRGILVGSVEDILFTNESIKAKIVLNNPNVILAKPSFAKVVTNSFLGMEQFDRTQANLDELIYMSKEATVNLKPLINDIQKVANHLNSILSTIDDEETLNDVKLTLNAARSISTKVDNMSDDFEKLMKDKKLTKSIRDLTIGLAKFLNEVYP